MRILILLLISIPSIAQLPVSGSLSLKSAAGAGRSISDEVDGNETGNKSLTTLSLVTGKTANHSMLEFYGYTSTIPNAPTNVIASDGGPGQPIGLSWTAPATGGKVSYYRVERSINGGSYVFLNNVIGTTTVYSDPVMSSAGSDIQYRVSSYNGAGNSSTTVSNSVLKS